MWGRDIANQCVGNSGTILTFTFSPPSPLFSPSLPSPPGSLGGGGGSGDSELQMQRYRILRRIKAIRQDLRSVRETRELHRRGRKAAGKSMVPGILTTTSSARSPPFHHKLHVA